MDRARVDPRSLLTPERLDIAVKWRFFGHLLTGGDPDAERVYRWHIDKRTAGREKGSWKRSLDDYVRGARELLASMRAGFDPEHPITLGSNGRLMYGAHRLSLSLLLNFPVCVVRRSDKPGRAAAWDLQWFVSRGLAPDDVKRILKDWDRLNGAQGDHRHAGDA